ncbi:MAG: rod-binding protein [Desulfobacterales bacterium]|jgi:Rod binding domain-containing protein
MTDTFLTPGLLRPPGGARPTAVGHRANDENCGRLREACSEFEALFINLLLKELRATVGKSGLMDGGRAEEVYTGMMDTEMARDLAAKGGIGLAAILYRQLEPARAERLSVPGPSDPAGSETAARRRQSPGRAGDAKVLMPAADKPTEAP